MYSSNIWDPFLLTISNIPKKIQREAARFIKGDYRSKEPGFVTQMLKELELLQQSRKKIDYASYLR